MCRRLVAIILVLTCASLGLTAEPEQNGGLRKARQQMARLHWQQAVAARDVESDSIKATHHFLHAGKLWADVGHEQDVMDALHAASSTNSLIDLTIVHGLPIRAAAFSPDEKFVFTCSLESNTARIWSLETGELFRELKHAGAVVGGVFHDGGQLLATNSYDGVYLWDLEQPQPIDSIDLNEGTSIHGPATEIRFRAGTRQVLIQNRGSLILWEAGRQEYVTEYQPWATAMDMDAAGKRLLIAGRSKRGRAVDTAQVWDVESGKRLSSFQHPAWVARAMFLPNDRILTFAYDEDRDRFSSTGRVWSLGKDKPIATLSGGHGTESLVVDQTGTYALSAGTGNLMTRDAFLWSLGDGSKITTYTHEEKIGGALFARTHPGRGAIRSPEQQLPDEQLIVTYTTAGTVKIWLLDDHRLLQVLRHPAGISGILLSPNGEWLGLWDQTGTAKIFAMPDNPWRSPLLELRQVLRHAAGIRGIKFLKDDRVVTWSDDGSLRVWNLRAGQPSRKLFRVTPNRIGKPPPVRPAGENSWWTAWNGAVSVWSEISTNALHEWPSGSKVSGVAGSRNGKLFLTWGDDQVARLWTHNGDEAIQKWPHETTVSGGTFLPDNSTAVTWAGNTLTVWDAEQETAARRFRMQSKIVAVELLPHERAVVGCDSGELSIITLLNNEPIAALDRITGLTGMKVSADKQRVAVWNPQKRITVQQLDGSKRPHSLSIDTGDFELDADLNLVLVTRSTSRQAWLYSMETGKLLKQFHQDGQVDRELFQFRIASPKKIVSWGNRPHSNRVRLRVWSVDRLTSPTVAYELPGLPRDFAALDDGIVVLLFGSEAQALSLRENRVLRRFRQHRFGLNQLLFAAKTSQMYTTNPRGEFWEWDFHRQDPQTIEQAIREFEGRSGMTIDSDRRYRMLRAEP